jgi:two-component system, OmpR family, sensor kinase
MIRLRKKTRGPMLLRQMQFGTAGDDHEVEALSERIATLEARIADLTEAVRARDDFIAVAAHELRNPLTPLNGQIELLLGLARRTPGAGIFTTGLERLARLSNGYMKRAMALLDVARIASGKFRLEFTQVDLSALVREIAADFTAAATHAKCSLRIVVEEGIAGSWDRLAVEQVIDNLLANAIKYGAGKPVTVSLRCAGAAAQLTVRDAGIGISQADEVRIFDRFERAVPKGTHLGGFGLGLWLSRQLVLAMDGAMAVSSEPGNGSTFTVTLPIKVG